MAIFLILPSAYLFSLSFTADSFTASGVRWVGLRNYLSLLLSPDCLEVLGNTVYFTLAKVITSLIISFILAVLLNKSFKVRGFLRFNLIYIIHASGPINYTNLFVYYIKVGGG